MKTFSNIQEDKAALRVDLISNCCWKKHASIKHNKEKFCLDYLVGRGINF